MKRSPKGNKSGFRFSAKDRAARAARLNRVFSIALSLLMAAGLLGAFMSMTRRTDCWLPVVLTGVTAALLTQLAWRFRRVRFGLILLLVAATAIWVAARPQAVGDGFSLLGDYLVEAGETGNVSGYDFVMTGTVSAEQLAALCNAMIPVALLIGMASAAIVQYRSVPFACLLLFVLVLLAVTLGTYPSLVWSFVLAVAYVLCAGAYGISKGQEGHTAALYAAAAMLLILVLVITATSQLTFPGRIEAMAQLSDQLRQQILPQTPTLDTDSGQESEVTLPETAQTQPPSASVSVSSPPESPSWGWWLLAAVAALIVASLLAAAGRLLLSWRRRRCLEQAGHAAAIDGFFRQTTRWLTAFGASVSGTSEDAGQLGACLPPEYVARYEEIRRLWQEALYSSHEMGAAERESAKQFLTDTQQLVLQQVPRHTRLIYRWRCLY